MPRCEQTTLRGRHPRMGVAGVAIGLLVLSIGCSGPETSVSERDMERASQVLAPYKTQLKGTLMEALEEGPEVAIGVCQSQAPLIAASVAPPGVTLGRTSHRLRNPENAPQPWMRPLLTTYLDNPGDQPPRAVDRGDGTFGYVEPILMQPPCETCHGPTVEASLGRELKVLYPDDEATGFVTGELRGLFWVRMPATPG